MKDHRFTIHQILEENPEPKKEIEELPKRYAKSEVEHFKPLDEFYEKDEK